MYLLRYIQKVWYAAKQYYWMAPTYPYDIWYTKACRCSANESKVAADVHAGQRSSVMPACYSRNVNVFVLFCTDQTLYMFFAHIHDSCGQHYRQYSRFHHRLQATTKRKQTKRIRTRYIVFFQSRTHRDDITVFLLPNWISLLKLHGDCLKPLPPSRIISISKHTKKREHHESAKFHRLIEPYSRI